MTAAGWVQLAAVGAALLVIAPLLGRYLAAVHGGGPSPGDRVFGAIERPIYRLIGVDPDRGQRWNAYAVSVLAFSLVSVLLLYVVLRVQTVLPFNPTGAPAVPPELAFNTAISFVTGTNWQAYAGETTMGHFSQMAGLVVAQFTAAAVGMSVALALVRGLIRRRHPETLDDERNPGSVGNFWVDLVRNTVRVLLPIAIVATIVLVSQGVVQNFSGGTEVQTVVGEVQVVPGGPAASEEVMKTLGTNGGGFYNANSAHPFENPTGFTNTFQLLLVLAIPFAFPLMYGRLSGKRGHGRTIVSVMAVLWLAPILVASYSESGGNPRIGDAGVTQIATGQQAGGNMEGKEVRLGPAGSSLLAVGTMGTSAGVASSALDSYTPVGGASAFGPILLGEISPGGVGTGLYGILIYVLLAVFVGGLMVGRTPEYLGKKLRGTEMKFVSLYLLAVPIVVLAGAAVTVLMDSPLRSVPNPGSHGFTEIVYAFVSAANGNGSAFAGLNANTDWFNIVLGVVMLVGRFAPMLIALALAGSLRSRRVFTASTATLPVSGPTFATLLIGVLLIIGGLTYLPALALGPLAEQLSF